MPSASPIIDMHAHILAEDTIEILRRETPSVAPQLSEITAEGARLEVAGVHQNPFPRGAWDLERRLADMARCGFDMQVLAVCPQTLMYDQEPALALTVAQIQNEQIAALCRAMPERFLGLATAPMQAPERAAEELRRAVRELGLRGVMIGSSINGTNLDDPALEPFWQAAADTGAFVLIHPIKPTAGERTKGYYLKNLIGNPLETTIAAASLVFGGVLERHPSLKICLSHGGGFAPYQFGRFIHGWRERPEARLHLGETSPAASLDRLLYDTILHHPEPLAYLVSMAGPGRVMLGSDYPFDMGMYDGVSVVKGLPVGEDAIGQILSGTAQKLLVTKAGAAA